MPWEDARLMSHAEISELGKDLISERDVIYLNPSWCEDRIVLWGIDGSLVLVEFQKATEAKSYFREESIQRLPEVLLSLREMFASPLEHGFEWEQF